MVSTGVQRCRERGYMLSSQTIVVEYMAIVNMVVVMMMVIVSVTVVPAHSDPGLFL